MIDKKCQFKRINNKFQCFRCEEMFDKPEDRVCPAVDLICEEVENGYKCSCKKCGLSIEAEKKIAFHVCSEESCHYKEVMDDMYVCEHCDNLLDYPVYQRCPKYVAPYLVTIGKAKSGKNKFLCERCGYKYKGYKIKKIPHRCEDYICEWEPEGEECKCKNCGIVLPTEEIRACSAKTGLQGIGDIIAKAAKLVGQHQKEGCGCGEKQKKLNDMFPL